MFVILKGHDGYPPGERTLERFSATASCPAGQPNECRSRAKEKVLKCMQASWDERWQRETPDECKPDKGINGYSMSNIKCDLYDRICAEAKELLHPAFGSATAIVKGQSSGQTNACLVSERIYGEYVVKDCATLQGRVEHCGQ